MHSFLQKKLKVNYVNLFLSIAHQTNCKLILKHLQKIFELNVDTVTGNIPFLTVVLNDCNFKSNLWFKGDKTLYGGSKLMLSPSDSD